jgi:hypothetical protein
MDIGLSALTKDKPLIGDETQAALDEYRGFRHVVRNVYTFKFDPLKVHRLIEEAPRMFSQMHAELLAFADFGTTDAGG